jgi:hypothetical protein
MFKHVEFQEIEDPTASDYAAHLQNHALRNLLLLTSPWCFCFAQPFLYYTFESSRPPTFKCGNLFKGNTCLMVFECQSKVTGSDCSNISVAMSRIRWICLNSLMFGTTLGAVIRVSGRRIHVGRVALLHAMMTTPSPTWRCHACSPEPWRNYATFFLGI